MFIEPVISQTVHQEYVVNSNGENYHPATLPLLYELKNISSNFCNAETNSELEAVLKKYANNPKGWPVLHYAVHVGDLPSVTVLLNNGYNIDERAPGYYVDGSELSEIAMPGDKLWEDGSTPLEIAIENGDLKLLKLLLDSGANPHSMRRKAGGLVCSGVFRIMLRYLVNCGVWPPRPNVYLPAFQLLIDSGVDLKRECVMNDISLRTPQAFIDHHMQHGVPYAKEAVSVLQKMLDDAEQT